MVARQVVTLALVDVVVLTYRPELSLARCVESALADKNVRVIVAVNNDAEVVGPVFARLSSDWDGKPVTLLHLGRNWGYADGLNRALAMVEAPLVLLLNDDAWPAPDAIAEMVDAMRKAGPRVAGIVPKILVGDSERIDCVGASILADGWVANRGYGDLDEGQYDRTEEVAGACFAAVLLRKEAIEDVGPLWSALFMYAEDADWCLRARLAGWRFVTCPGAVVRHEHSLSSATLPPAWKARQIRRNSMLVVVRCFPPRHALGLSLVHLWEGLKGWPARSGPPVRTAWPFLKLLPVAVAERRRTRGWSRESPVDKELFDDRVFAQLRRSPGTRGY
jgi:GT2 family glycosyltransferase